MRRVSIWASGLLASAIPFIFVGAVIVLGARIFEAVGQHGPPAHSSAPLQTEVALPEQVLTVASVDAPSDVAQRQPSKHAHGGARHHQAQSRSHSRVTHSSLVNQWGPVFRRADPGLHWFY